MINPDDNPTLSASTDETIQAGDQIGAQLSENNIKIVSHPNSRISTKVYSFMDFCALEDHAHPAPGSANPLPNSQKIAWRPFRTRQDFEFAELTLTAHMNQKQIDKLIKLIWDAVPENARSSSLFTLQSNSDLQKMWKFARETRATGVRLLNFLCESMILIHTSSLNTPSQFPTRTERCPTKSGSGQFGIGVRTCSMIQISYQAFIGTQYSDIGIRMKRSGKDLLMSPGQQMHGGTSRQAFPDLMKLSETYGVNCRLGLDRLN